MHVFVAGATGVIGRRLVPLLVGAGHRVTAAGRSAERLAALGRLGARGATVDLFDPGAVRRALEGVDVVVNLATAVPRPGPGMLLRRSWRGMDRVRKVVPANLVDAALAGATVQRMVQESFAPIYEAAGDAWVSESSAIRPAAYNRSALDAEGAAARFTAAGRIGVVLRFGMFYGPGDRSTLTILASLRKGWMPMFGRPDAYAAWIAQDDAAAAAAAALSVPAGIYNVVDDEPMRRQDLADSLARLLRVKPPRFPPAFTTRLGGSVGETMARSLRVSNRKLREASGWAPRYRSALDGFATVVGSLSPSPPAPAPPRRSSSS